MKADIAALILIFLVLPAHKSFNLELHSIIVMSELARQQSYRSNLRCEAHLALSVWHRGDHDPVEFPSCASCRLKAACDRIWQMRTRIANPFRSKYAPC
jgi:hypothetical protein